MSKLQGKIAVITGGTSGIGLATAHRFAAEGAQVVITGRRQEPIDEAIAALAVHQKPGAPVPAVGLRADSAELPDIERLVAVIGDRFGRIDVLFLNAGVAEFVPLEAATPEHFDRTFDINLRGPLFTVQKALPLLSRGSSVIFNTSIIAERGMPATAVYAASKAGLRALARSLAAELAPRGIRVNAVSPGPTETPIFGKVGLDKQQLDEFAASVVSRIPLARFGQPDEIAAAALFLASNDSSFLVGTEIVADGGLSQV